MLLGGQRQTGSSAAAPGKSCCWVWVGSGCAAQAGLVRVPYLHPGGQHSHRPANTHTCTGHVTTPSHPGHQSTVPQPWYKGYQAATPLFSAAFIQ